MARALFGLISGVAGCGVLGACSSFGTSSGDGAVDGGLEVTTSDALADVDTAASDGNESGHRYEVVVVTGGITWSQARTAAESRGGHLATLTSKSENDFVWALVTKTPGAIRTTPELNRFGPWIGGVQDPNAQEPGGGWTWITGEPWSFTQWAKNEPNNDRASGGGVDEEWLHFYAYNTSAPTWADGPNDARCHSYVIEWE